jgi:transporter family-2 protein
MKIAWLVMTFLAGILIPAQAAMNARMRTFVGNPLYSAGINFLVGLTALTIVIAISSRLGQAGSWQEATRAPWWAWCGGCIGVLIVLSGVLVIPRTGAAVFTATIMIGQLAGALILDHYGLFGLQTRIITPSRVVGMLLLLLGIWFVQRR